MKLVALPQIQKTAPSIQPCVTSFAAGADGRRAYPELFAVIGGKTPDYRSWFLRGGTAGQAGNEAQDSIRSHAHELTEHAHTLTIKDVASKDDVASMTPIYDTVTVGGISGVPLMQIDTQPSLSLSAGHGWVDLFYSCPNFGSGYNKQQLDHIPRARLSTPRSFKLPCSFPVTIYYIYDVDKTYSCSVKITKENTEYSCETDYFWSRVMSKITATLQTQSSGSSSITYVSGMKMAPGSSAVNGTTDPGGAGQTMETGDAETAPKHKFVRYLIRARP